MSNAKPGPIRRLLVGAWTLVDFTRRLVFNLLFFGLLLVFLGVLAAGDSARPLLARTTLVIAPEGRLIPMGFASGTVPQIPANILLVKNVTVIGFYYGYYNGWGGKAAPTPKEAVALAKRRALVMDAQAELMRWFTEGKLKATISATLDLADWVKAFKLIEERTVVGKAVLVP